MILIRVKKYLNLKMILKMLYKIYLWYLIIVILTIREIIVIVRIEAPFLEKLTIRLSILLIVLTSFSFLPRKKF